MLKYWFKKGNRIGYLSDNGSEVFSDFYEETKGENILCSGYFKSANDTYMFSTAKGIGLISLSGDCLLPGEFEAIVYRGNDMVLVKQNNLYGYYSISKKKLIVPCIYTYATPFVLGADFAAVRMNDKMGFISNEGHFASEFKYDRIDTFNNVFIVKVNNKYAVLDANLNIISPFVYDYCSALKCGLILIEINGKCGLLNQDGILVIPFVYDNVGHVSGKMVELVKDDAGYVFDSRGRQYHEGLLATSYYIDGSYRYFHSGMGRIKVDDKYGYINESGELCVSPQFEDAKEFEGEFAPVKSNGKWGVINKKGGIIVPFKYDRIIIKGNYFIVSEGRIVREQWGVFWSGKWGVVAEDGTLLKPISFNSDYDFRSCNDDDDILIYKENDNYGVFNKAVEIIPNILTEPPVIKYGLMVAKCNGLVALLSLTGKVIVPYEIQEIRILSPEVIAIKKDDGELFYIENINSLKKSEPLYSDARKLDGECFMLMDFKGITLYTDVDMKFTNNSYDRIEALSDVYFGESDKAI